MSKLNDIKQTVQEQFNRVYGYEAQHIVQAPGRVNLIGEHTDYNDGFVLPCAINFQTVVAISPRKDAAVNVVAVDYDNAKDTFLINEPIVSSNLQWANYIRGVVNCLINHGFSLSGADIVVSGDVPQGAGLSSSAALEVVIGQAFNIMNQLNISSEKIALIGQQAENEFVGCQCGIMDQLVSAKGRVEHAMLLDCRNLQTTDVNIPKNLSIVIVNSNVKRGLVDSEYNTRRKQCEMAAEFFNVKALRDVDIEAYNKAVDALDPLIAKRAKHVITENIRTVSAAQALKNNDINTLATLMEQSHQSMRDDFEITVPQIDLLVDLIKNVVKDNGGVRMTGGGFGGCVVALVPENLIAELTKVINISYKEKTGIMADIYVCQAMQGASEI